MLEGADWGMPVILKDPTGTTQTVEGQVLRSVISVNPENGEPIVSPNPVITLRTSSLSIIPEDGENWYFQIPSTPDPDSTKVEFVLDGSKAIENNGAFGFIKIFLTDVEQTTP
jgi:hypothetical protein